MREHLGYLLVGIVTLLVSGAVIFGLSYLLRLAYDYPLIAYLGFGIVGMFLAYELGRKLMD